MPNKDSVQIAPAEGKLGVLMPGMGAVTTTFIAGLEAFKRGLGKPIGSLTQLGTVRLGKRTEGRSPAIKDFVPLARLEDIEVGCWDIFEDNALRGGGQSRRTGNALLEQVKEPLSAIKPMKAVFDQNFVKRMQGSEHQGGGSKMDHAEMVMDDIGSSRSGPGVARTAMIWCGSTEVYHEAGGGPRDAEGFRVRAEEERSGDFAEPDLRVRGAEIAACRTPTARRT